MENSEDTSRPSPLPVIYYSMPDVPQLPIVVLAHRPVLAKILDNYSFWFVELVEPAVHGSSAENVLCEREPHFLVDLQGRRQSLERRQWIREECSEDVGVFDRLTRSGALMGSHGVSLKSQSDMSVAVSRSRA